MIVEGGVVMAQGRRWVDPSKKLEYLEWLLTVPGEREPATKTDVAVHLGVSMRTLYNWEGEPDFQEKMRSVKLQWGSRWYPEILEELMKVIKDGPPAQKVQAARVLLQHIDIKENETATPEMEQELLKRMTAVLKELGFDTVDG
jgi:hypothetical protein